MVDIFDEEILKRIIEIQGDTCISIYIPTHQEGLEVNENMDIISFKNEVQDIKIQLSEYGLDNGSIDKLLKPAWELINDTSFWKFQSHGLAVFIKDDYFQYLRLPVSFKIFSVISSRFVFSPLIQALEMNNKFYILSLNQYEFKLFESSLTSIKEVLIEDELKAKVEETLAPFDYRNDLYETTDPGGNSASVGLKKQVLERAKQNGDVNLSVFFRTINDIVISKIRDVKVPLVLAGLEEWQSNYRKINKYRNLWEQGYLHNAQFLSPKELHKQVLTLIAPYFDKPQERSLSRYNALAGTGRTSYALENILFDASAGRIDTLFIPKDFNVWGTYDIDQNEVVIHNSSYRYNYCLLNYAASITLSNSGNVFMVDSNQMPEQGNIAAIYRY
jgi:hypothetical protein